MEPILSERMLGNLPEGLKLFGSQGDFDEHLRYATDGFSRQMLGHLLKESSTQNQAIRYILTPVIFAGCGSTGYAGYNGYIRNLAPFFAIGYDPDVFELSNLPRQMEGIQQVGDNKAESFALTMKNLLPYSNPLYVPTGVDDRLTDQVRYVMDITTEINDYLSTQGIEPVKPIIVDGVDVTTVSGWEAKMHLHEVACKNEIPTFGGLDVGSYSIVNGWNYQEGQHSPFDGRVTRTMLSNPQVCNMALLPKIFGMIPDVSLTYAKQYIERAKTIIGLRESLSEGDITSEEYDERFPRMPQEESTAALYRSVVPIIAKQVVDGYPFRNWVEVYTLGNRSTYQRFRLALTFLVGKKIIERAGKIESSRRN